MIQLDFQNIEGTLNYLFIINIFIYYVYLQWIKTKDSKAISSFQFEL
jgi:hypothetical protein